MHIGETETNVITSIVWGFSICSSLSAYMGKDSSPYLATTNNGINNYGEGVIVTGPIAPFATSVPTNGTLVGVSGAIFNAYYIGCSESPGSFNWIQHIVADTDPGTNQVPRIDDQYIDSSPPFYFNKKWIDAMTQPLE